MREVKLTQGYTATISDKDYGRVSQSKWQAYVRRDKNKNIVNVYAGRQVYRSPGKTKTELLHRFILGIADPKVQVDHRDCVGLHCQRSNLRIATPLQNACNVGLRKDNSSGFKGVDWHKHEQLWRARINVGGKSISLGYFHTKEAAAKAYNAAAKKYHGRFAKLNKGAQ